MVATKVRFSGTKEHHNAKGLSRKTIEQELEHSLDRLGMETVGLIHRWDHLTRPHDEFTATARGEHELDYGTPYHEGPASEEINGRVEGLAEEKGITMAQIALAWHFQNDNADAPIVGTLSVEYLEEPYHPVLVFGHE